MQVTARIGTVFVSDSAAATALVNSLLEKCELMADHVLDLDSLRHSSVESNIPKTLTVTVTLE